MGLESSKPSRFAKKATPCAANTVAMSKTHKPATRIIAMTILQRITAIATSAVRFRRAVR
jgi:hypothetical protein